jgi:hypothetical protein
MAPVNDDDVVLNMPSELHPPVANAATNNAASATNKATTDDDTTKNDAAQVHGIPDVGGTPVVFTVCFLTSTALQHQRPREFAACWFCEAGYLLVPSSPRPL